jgi:hypothetical protein
LVCVGCQRNAILAATEINIGREVLGQDYFYSVAIISSAIVKPGQLIFVWYRKLVITIVLPAFILCKAACGKQD